MAISLQKGQKISLTKDAPGLKHVVVGLGWDEVKQGGGGFFGLGAKKDTIDCDASAILLQHDKLVAEDDVVYYGRLKHKSGAIRHCGDNLTGEGEGDDEQIIVDLNNVPSDYNKIVFVVNIYHAVPKKQDFGLIKNAFIRLVDGDTNKELARYDLTENYAGKTAMIFGEMYRYENEWKFNAIGRGTYDESISTLIQAYK